MISDSFRSPEDSRLMHRDPFVPSQKLESYFLSLARQIESWREIGSGSVALGIAGLRPRIGASTVAYNLAACLAGTRNTNVCVVECNFGRPFVSRRISNELPGLSDLMRGDRKVENCLQCAGPVRLSLIGPGTLSLAEANRLVNKGFPRVVEELKLNFEWVICDLPVASPLTTCYDLASHLNGAALVVGPKDGLDPMTREATHHFRRLEIDLVGLIRNHS